VEASATALDRALGALYGLAVGDALGMPTQELSRQRAEELLGGEPRFHPGPPDNPVSAGLPAGSVTDDTEQALLLARCLVAGDGVLDPLAWARALASWEDRVRERGGLDLLGPSTRQALAAVRSGADPRTTGRSGTTNGAAMRIAPVGVAVRPRPRNRLVEGVAQACLVTHDTAEARSGAAAVAAVVSLGVEGTTFATALPEALEIAALAAGPSPVEPADGGQDVPARILRAVDLARRAAEHAGPGVALDAITVEVGTGVATRESVPAAFAVAALAPDDPWRAAQLAARLGGDADTIAAMAGAMTGACSGAHRIPAQALATVEQAGDLGIPEAVAGLLALRARS
jgi:ADP-ribosylglycohydrolase